MPGIARDHGTDSVNTVHGAVGGSRCNAAPTTVATDAGSANVFVNGIGVVRSGDAVQSHHNLSLIHIPSPRDRTRSRMPSSA